MVVRGVLAAIFLAIFFIPEILCGKGKECCNEVEQLTTDVTTLQALVDSISKKDSCRSSCAELKGDEGRRGKRGKHGHQGAQGPIGPTGHTGPKGPRGFTGKKGEPGKTKPTSCPTGFIQHAGSCYSFMYDQGASWFDALSYCSTCNANLVAIESSAEYIFIVAKITSDGKNHFDFWTGGHFISGRWMWKGGLAGDSKPITFTKWHPGEPNNGQDNEKCIELRQYDHNWNDRDCLYPDRFICEIKL